MKPQNITVIGAGGIGSWTAFLLARIGHSMLVYDHDVIEPHNIGGQLFRLMDVGAQKVTALHAIIGAFTPNPIFNALGRYEKGHMVNNITILAVDNMETRKIAFDLWAKQQIAEKESGINEDDIRILIDGRLEGEQGIIYAVDSPTDIKRWQEEWFPDSNVDDGPCTMRSTSYNGAMIAANIIGVLNNKIANKVTGEAIRDVPFKVFYGFPAMYYETTH